MMKMFKVLFLALFVLMVSFGTASAVPVFAVDTTQAVEDITAGGLAVISVSVLMYGFSKLRQMLKA